MEHNFVAKVHSVVHEHDIHQPWIFKETSSVVTGTVFFVNGSDVGIDKNIVGITNAHCVEDNRSGECRVIQNGTLLGVFQVVRICPSEMLDFAVLVPKPGVVHRWATVPLGMHPLKTGEPVMIPGYPYDSDSCQCAYGSTSAHGDGYWMQCNVASNFGNSGGPLIHTKTGRVHGIVTQSPAGSESITEVLPMWVLVSAIKRGSDRSIVRVPGLDISVSPMCPQLAAHVGAESSQPGAYVQRSGIKGVREGDILVKVHGFPVCNYTGQVHTPMAGIVDIENEALALQIPMTFSVTLVRKGVKGQFISNVRQSSPDVVTTIREVYPMWEPVCNVRFGGAVFVNLNKNMLDEDTENNDRLKHAWGTWTNRHEENQHAVFVSYVAPQQYADDCGLEPFMQLISIDNYSIFCIQDLISTLLQKKHKRNHTALLKFKDFAMVANTREFYWNTFPAK
tara:strand:- start:2058 stop:3407 length:1350 start_codon:yes stop_codon:yes gene_type:complete